jgi:hypothetical protein
LDRGHRSVSKPDDGVLGLRDGEAAAAGKAPDAAALCYEHSVHLFTSDEPID